MNSISTFITIDQNLDNKMVGIHYLGNHNNIKQDVVPRQYYILQNEYGFNIPKNKKPKMVFALHLIPIFCGSYFFFLHICAINIDSTIDKFMKNALLLDYLNVTLIQNIYIIFICFYLKNTQSIAKTPKIFNIMKICKRVQRSEMK